MGGLSAKRDCVAFNAESSQDNSEWKVEIEQHRTLFDVQFDVGRRVFQFIAGIFHFFEIDSVPNGGWLDGSLDTLAGVEILRRISEQHKGKPPVTVRLVDWCDEEGARFGKSLFGSSACSGKIDMDETRGLKDRDGVRLVDALKEHGIDFNPTFIIGGQIGGESPRLFNVYSAGNFIETTADTRYFQIGESKYGKPIIDRVVNVDTSLAAVAKCALISMDSTIRSNLSVGMPLDLAVVRRGELRISSHQSVGPDDAYFKMIREGWGESLRNAFHALPDPPIP